MYESTIPYVLRLYPLRNAVVETFFLNNLVTSKHQYDEWMVKSRDDISFPIVGDKDTNIDPLAASPWHAQAMVNGCIMVPNNDKYKSPRKQMRRKEGIPWPNRVVLMVVKVLFINNDKLKLRCVWLTHWCRDKMAAFFQTTFSKAFSSIKIYKFSLKFHWRLFLMLQWTVFHHWFR